MSKEPSSSVFVLGITLGICGLVLAVWAALVSHFDYYDSAFPWLSWAFSFETAAAGLFVLHGFMVERATEEQYRKQAMDLLSLACVIFEMTGQHHLKNAAESPKGQENVRNFWKVVAVAALILSKLESLDVAYYLNQTRNVIIAAFRKARTVAVARGLSVEYSVLSTPAVRFLVGQISLEQMPIEFLPALASLVGSGCELKLTKFEPEGVPELAEPTVN